MPESESSNSQNSWFSFNGLLAVVTLVGGVVLVSHRLTSERPQRTGPEGTRPLGVQNIESRLWEDPFAGWDKLAADQRAQRANADLTSNLVAALARELSFEPDPHVLLLGVMVSGQPYAEDTESRVRARYAVGAALAAGGYAPRESDHIGLSACPWPSSRELDEWKTNTMAELRILAPSPILTNGTNFVLPPKVCPGFCTATDTNLHLRVPFEVYERQDYFPSAEFFTNAVNEATNRYTRVLLVWLDEEYFDDAPALRLALFMNKVERALPGEDSRERVKKLHWTIIGPRTSTTLQTLLQEPLAGTATNLWQMVTSKLGKARLILATPSAMDQVLIPISKNMPEAQFDKPRAAVAAALGNGHVFKSVTNVACTDLQFARETLHELSLRGVSPVNKPKQHLVLISEWDTYFSRMSGLAFAAEFLAQRTNVLSAREFIMQVHRRTNVWPANLHRCVYLRGLDGEAAETEGSKDRRAQKEDRERQRPTSIEEIRKWTPDGNKAEGQAQFDYLARVGERLGTLDRDLWRNEGGRVAAVGIIGSDVYDTLLILQALRNRLPDAVFFTSDLDARFWGPRELAWTRNLVVISGYGLQLSKQLQAGVAPFRASFQSALFLATLSALDDPRLKALDELPLRRFEIGTDGPVDLSTNAAWLHPRSRPEHPWSSRWNWAGVIGICVIPLLGLLVWKTPRRFIFPMQEYCCEPLELSDHHFGGDEGLKTVFDELLTQSQKNGDTLATWLSGAQSPSFRLSEQAKSELIARFNNLVFMKDKEGCPPLLAIIQTSTKWFCRDRRKAWEANRSMAFTRRLKNFEMFDNYKAAHTMLRRLLSPSKDLGRAADCARHTALLTHERRQRRWKFFYVTVVSFALLGGGMFYGAWRDNYSELGGEPFNFAGTSAWPAEFIRFGVVVISLVALCRTQRALSQSILKITRDYRFVLDKRSLTVKWADVWNSVRVVIRGIWPPARSCLTDLSCRSPLMVPEAPMPEVRVGADGLWRDYARTRHWKARLVRVTACVLAYWGAGLLLFGLTGFPFRPIRGHFLGRWDIPLLFAAVTAMLYVTFWMIDEARLCAWFIGRLSHRPTEYSSLTLARFSEARAIADRLVLEEWIDLQVTADLTEPVARLVYLPFVALLLMLLARNPLWDRWPWHWPLAVIFGLNMVFAAASSIMLQRAARNARTRAIEKLREKANQKEREAAPSMAAHEATQVNRLLEEIKNLRRGAFVPLGQNPLMGALLLNSSGAVLLEILAKVLSK